MCKAEECQRGVYHLGGARTDVWSRAEKRRELTACPMSLHWATAAYRERAMSRGDVGVKPIRLLW